MVILLTLGTAAVVRILLTGSEKFLAPIDYQRCFDPFMESAERSRLLPSRRVADNAANHQTGSRATQQGDSPLHSLENLL